MMILQQLARQCTRGCKMKAAVRWYSVETVQEHLSVPLEIGSTEKQDLHMTQAVSEQELALYTNQNVPAGARPRYVHIPLTTFETGSTSDQILPLSANIFALPLPLRRDILHRCVTFQRAAWRQGSASSKTRSEVQGSSRKVRPQKGQGKARIGSIRAPHIRGGGVAFGPKPRDYSFALPTKIWKLGLRTALSSKWNSGLLNVLDQERLKLDSLKTQAFKEMLENKQAELKQDWTDVLIVTGQGGDQDIGVDYNLDRASRNLEKVDILQASEINVYDLLLRKRLICDLDAIKGLEQMLAVD